MYGADLSAFPGQGSEGGGRSAEDIGMFVRMADATHSREHQIKATEILLAGITRVAPHEAGEAASRPRT